MKKTFYLTDYKVRCDFVGTDAGGFSEKFNPTVAAQNTNRLIASHGSKHSTRIAPGVDYEARIALPSEDVVEAGSLLTDVIGHTLILRPADCIPLVVYGRHEPVLALIHCGRRELDADIIGKTINLLNTTWHIEPSGLKAFLGPGIKKDSYLLPSRIKDTLRHHDWGGYIDPVGDLIAVDLFGFATSQLIKAGIEEDKIDISPINTATNPKYYSHYATTNYSKMPGLNGFAVTMSVMRF